jgi:hypothetical protein
MKRTIGALVFLLCLTAGVSPQGATPQSPDGRVKAALDQIGYKYELTADGDFKLAPLPTEGGRTQLVYVNSNTARFGTLEIREVLSPAFLSDGPLTADLANSLLRLNHQVKLGAWRVIPITKGSNSGKQLVMFAAQVAGSSDAEALRMTIRSVVLVADRMEKEVTGRDDY